MFLSRSGPGSPAKCGALKSEIWRSVKGLGGVRGGYYGSSRNYKHPGFPALTPYFSHADSSGNRIAIMRLNSRLGHRTTINHYAQYVRWRRRATADLKFRGRVEEGRGCLGHAASPRLPPRSSNCTCPIKACSFPTGFTERLSAAVQGARVEDAALPTPRGLLHPGSVVCRALAPGAVS